MGGFGVKLNPLTHSTYFDTILEKLNCSLVQNSNRDLKY